MEILEYASRSLEAAGVDATHAVIGLMVLLAAMALPLLLFPSQGKSTSTAKSDEVKVYSRAEVAKHSKEDDLWIILKTKEQNKYRVYDVTPYVDQHPGGMSIMNNAGGDATMGFYGDQHPPRVFDIFEDYYIGDLFDP
mmetsp:Transcript_29725/g.83782  ORF Transcript_29725/g.83782 Transcript_29725/m.83782 type:complete len:138 (-) Transcript_29725:1180-1593(-)